MSRVLQQWGTLLKQSRDFMRLASVYFPRDLLLRAAAYITAYAYCLKAHMRQGRARKDPKDPTSFRDDPSKVCRVCARRSALYVSLWDMLLCATAYIAPVHTTWLCMQCVSSNIGNCLRILSSKTTPVEYAMQATQRTACTRTSTLVWRLIWLLCCLVLCNAGLHMHVHWTCLTSCHLTDCYNSCFSACTVWHCMRFILSWASRQQLLVASFEELLMEHKLHATYHVASFCIYWMSAYRDGY